MREDRTIHFAADGEQVAFQHGRDGLFIAETDSAEPTKIFQPDADTIAVSAPLWSPTDKRLIFATATNADKMGKGRDSRDAEPEPEGKIHWKRRVLYTCWMRTEPKKGQPLNVPLFTVPCGHPGYVAANLAVRWHPDGQHVLYVKEDDKDQHRLYDLDLQTNASHQVFPHSANDLVFDWVPDKTHLVCVVSDKKDGSSDKGIRIGKPGTNEWWHVPDSADLGDGVLEDLREARPVWTSDSSRFAFVGKRKGKEKQPDVYSLHLGDLSARTVATVHRGEKAIRDLHWRRDGRRLGFLCGHPTGIFHLAEFEPNKVRPSDPRNTFISPVGTRTANRWPSSRASRYCTIPNPRGRFCSYRMFALVVGYGSPPTPIPHGRKRSSPACKLPSRSGRRRKPSYRCGPRFGRRIDRGCRTCSTTRPTNEVLCVG